MIGTTNRSANLRKGTAQWTVLNVRQLLVIAQLRTGMLRRVVDVTELVKYRSLLHEQQEKGRHCQDG